MSTLQAQREATVAASLYQQGRALELPWQEITKAMQIALLRISRGDSGATAYEAGEKVIRITAKKRSRS